jgi:FkbM family methyltransferase
LSISEFLYTVVCRPAPIRRLVNRLILTFLPKSVRLGRAEVLLNPQDPVVSGALAMGVYEKEEISLFARTIQPGMTVVDVGANLGAYSVVALDRLQGQGQLLAIEPAKENFFWLQKNLKQNLGLTLKTKVYAVRAALSNKAGVAVLHKNPANKGDNRLFPDNLLAGTEKVKTTTLDALCRQKEIRSIDVLKIDVQGFEGEVLAGSRRILQASRSCHLFSEFWAEGMRKAKTEPRYIVELLRGLGFNLYTYSCGSLTPIRLRSLVRQTSGRNYVNLYGVRRG